MLSKSGAEAGCFGFSEDQYDCEVVMFSSSH